MSATPTPARAFAVGDRIKLFGPRPEARVVFLQDRIALGGRRRVALTLDCGTIIERDADQLLYRL